ncbi:MAG: DUF2007 domain-containing protein [Planctomycetes bacterium]|nr:DUF2007 domain-containing protein [Planctomycetota bacterium]
MPFCPKCRSEYRPEITRCVDCDVDLVGELPALKNEGWAEVFSGEFGRAATVRAALESAGIRVVAPGEMISSFAPVYAGSAWFVKLLVPESEAGRAREIIRGMDRLEPGEPTAPSRPE